MVDRSLATPARDSELRDQLCIPRELQASSALALVEDDDLFASPD